MGKIIPLRRRRSKDRKSSVSCLHIWTVLWIFLFLATTFLLSVKLENNSLVSSSNNIIIAYWNETVNILEPTPRQQPQQQELQQQQPQTTANDNDNDKLLPYFVLHIGPQKTMSSAIQCSLQKLESNLTLDGYKFVGKCDARACYKNSPGFKVDKALIAPFYDKDCVQSITTATTSSSTPSSIHNVKCWKEFLASLDKTIPQNHSSSTTNSSSIILSDEKISEAQMMWWDIDMTTKVWTIVQRELRDRYQFQIVMVYRRYYEWLASIKNQGDKYSLGRRGMKLWNGPSKEAIFPHLMRWINNVSEIPSPYLPEMYHLYNNQLQLPVSLLNMHDGTDMLETFLCHSLKHTTHTCQAYRDNPAYYQSNSNPSINHFYDMIAYDAYHRGLVRDLRDWRKGADRLFYTEMIGRRMSKQHKTPWDLPLVCPSRDDVTPFLDISKQFEQEFLPTFFSTPEGETALEMKFWKDVDSQKFCSVNTTAVLEQLDWQVFFHNVWDPRRGTKPDDWETSDYKISLKNFTNK